MPGHRLILMGALTILSSFAITAQSQENRGPVEEIVDCNIKAAYPEMLSLPEWKNAHELYSYLLQLKRGSLVTLEQKEKIYLVMMRMGDGARKPDPGMVRKIVEDFTRALSKVRLSAYLKAGLSINMELAMRGVNDDYLPNMSTAAAFITNTLDGGGWNRRLAETIRDDIYTIAKAARGN